MSWSTVHEGNNESSVITFGVYLDLQNQLLKQHVYNFVAQMTLILACRVLQNLLSNLSRSKCKSWSGHYGEEHVKVWQQFDLVWTLNSRILLIAWNALKMLVWSSIIH
jgi:hypothetical protein